MQKNSSDNPVEDLLALMRRLRDKETGCPWDIEQDFKTIAPYTIEEAYEVADAIERLDMDGLMDELGDLLFQVVFLSQIASEKGLFGFEDVAKRVTTKMVFRHPHVFGDQKAASARDVENRIWEQRKAEEKAARESDERADSILDDVPVSLPALIRAQKLQKRAASVGFEWPEPIDVLDKLEEETAEMRAAIAGGRKEEVVDELGDLFFVITNLGRMLGTNCEECLRQANHKFERRFKSIEIALKQKNVDIKDATLAEMEALWQEEKAREKQRA